jgi:2-polyprenyl-6-methoxyphenol hydroxylase-like FAD-dependent oxidoreductase
MRILISGAGIAGPTLAWWLLHFGFTPTLVESASALKTGGYVIDFWGAGFDVADRMGLLPQIRRRGYVVEEVRAVDDNGRRAAAVSAKGFIRMTGGRFVSLPRGDLAAVLFASIENRAETLFGDRVAQVDQSPDGVHVRFEHAPPRTFDLVIGADGLHSGIRRLVFGDEPRFEKYLGYKAAAFTVSGYQPRDELVYILYTQVGSQVARFSMRDDRTMFLLTFADPAPAIPSTLADQKSLLRARFRNARWEVPAVLDALEASPELYFDRVSQIRMDARPGLWTDQRVTLLGDAASCVSLLAGQGSALAMIAAYLLAGELAQASGDYPRAFTRYQERFAPFVRKKQLAALRFAGMFAPRSRFALYLRNRGLSLMNISWIADFAMRRDLVDKIELPEYSPR